MNIKKLIELALSEDIGHADVTTQALSLTQKNTTAWLVAKATGVLAGLDIAIETFLQVDDQTSFIAYKKDGDTVQPGQEIAKITGKAASLLMAERVALNFLQRLSGIATHTRQLVDAIAPHNAKLLDTRKTTPLLRNLQKYAVRCGGGYNHRYGLYDMVMLKENHIRAVGGIQNAVAAVKKQTQTYRIEVETTNLDEVAQAIAAGADRVMLDNMPPEIMAQAVQLYKDKVELEASGNVTIDTINAIAATGVHFISCGAITHSYLSLDLSLLFEE